MIGPFYWRVLAASVTFWPAWGNTNWPLLGVGWTLCFEMLFYLALTVIIAAGRTRRAWMLAAAIYAVCLVQRLINPTAVTVFLGNGLIVEFIAGLIMGMVWKARRPRAGLIALAGGLSLWLVVAMAFARLPLDQVQVFSGHGDISRALMWGPAALAIVWGALQFQPEGWLARKLDWLGGASYSIYLTHISVLAVIDWFKPASVDLIILAGFPLSILAGCIVHQWIEKPLLSALRRPALPNRRAAIA